MVNRYYLVLSRPPTGVPDHEYDRWYDIHVGELLELPGFVSAQRFAADMLFARGQEPPEFTFATRYEIEGDFEEAMRRLRGGMNAYYFPDWFDGTSHASWECVSLGGRVVDDGPARAHESPLDTD
jgi:hypothetical protein